jgi:HAE1 family hydrophobic/amphiphilic exporter-1
MLVDSSIVVLESISRCREEGDDLRAAALRGTSEVRMAVIASTFTSIAVFAPMVFVHGVAGQAFGDLGLAVVISLLAALVVALLLIPMLASRGGFDLNEVILESALSTPFSIVNGLIKWASEVKKTAVDSPVIGWIVNRSVDVLLLLTLTVLVLLPIRSAMLAWRDFNQLGLRRSILLSPYIVIRTVIGFTLENLIACVLGTVACVIICWKFIVFPLLGVVLKVLLWAPSRIVDSVLSWSVSTYPALVLRVTQRPSGVLLMAGLCLAATVMLFRGLPSELLPEVHQGEFTFEVALPVGTPLEITDEVLSPVADAILAEREHIEALIVTLGFDPTTSQRSDEGEHSARFKVILDSADPATESLVVDRLRRRFVDLPDTNARVVRPVLFSFKTPIEVEVHGENLIELRRQAERVRSVMASLPELADVETTQRAGAPEVQIRYDRDQLARYDLNVSQVAARVRDSVKGSEATLYNLGDRRVPVMVRFREADRALVTQVSDFVVNPGADRPIPLSSVAEVDLAEGPAEVRRVDGRRVALVTANVAQGSLGGAVAAVENALNERVEWPADMTFFIAGQNQEWQQSQSSLMLALALSVFLVYVIMAMQFESLVQPFVIMLTIPLAFLGTGLALHALELSLSVVVFLGMIMLAGIVVNNAIVFIDYINTLRGRGMERDEAVVTAGSVRLRPILMTTATTVLGLLPMALGFGDGAELRAPMAVAVISGLVASTLLTLIIIPAVYVVFDRALDRFRASEPHPAEEPA